MDVEGGEEHAGMHWYVSVRTGRTTTTTRTSTLITSGNTFVIGLGFGTTYLGRDLLGRTTMTMRRTTTTTTYNDNEDIPTYMLPSLPKAHEQQLKIL